MKLLKYLAINGVFTASLYFGFIEEIGGALNLAYFMAWWAIIVSFCAYSDDAKELMQETGRPVPEWFDVVFDLCVVAVLVWYGAIATGLFYAIHIINLEHGYKDEN